MNKKIKKLFIASSLAVLGLGLVSLTVLSSVVFAEEQAQTVTQEPAEVKSYTFYYEQRFSNGAGGYDVKDEERVVVEGGSQTIEAQTQIGD